MASLPQPDAHPLLHRWPADYDMTGEGADLDADAAAQLASEASHHSLSCSGSNAEALHIQKSLSVACTDKTMQKLMQFDPESKRLQSHPQLPRNIGRQQKLESDTKGQRASTSQHLRQLSLAPILHRIRLQRTRAILPPMLTSPSRPSLADLISRSIFLTHTTVVSRKLARSLVSIRLQRRLAARPSAEALVTRCVLPPECVPGGAGITVAPALVAKKRAIERERVKDGLRRWVGSVWRGEVRSREEGVRMWEERVGVGRVWRLRRFWERVGS
ncbi:hypothetical protein B0T24DRAFT_691456 [Lasiosphaeria ovina]|uniref:Uncharacterized protein n=1 Tax=Lasiosphaeria ovina TaxID=92902 RepID=A0AAE0JTH6_9PEZI|nr:hypothetical protein B0T24DRAFT_691456 [Lasiosphaeria ovina]